MKKFYYFFLFVLIFNIVSAQTNFKPGYFVSNNKTTECLIKDEDWRTNPEQFEYKLNEEGEPKVRKLYNTQEFGIHEKYYFIKASVQIDQSTDIDSKINFNKSPEFEEKTVFLRVLVEGTATLFEYSNNSLNRFFYRIGTDKIHPLVYKRHKITTDSNVPNSGYTQVKIAENNAYKQDLFNHVFCDQLDVKNVEQLDYNAKKLKAYFIKFNSCSGNQINFREVKSKRKLFNFYLKSAIDFTDTKVTNTVNGDRNINFGSDVNIRLGFEVEFILPFKNNKWSIFLEPTYHSYTNDASRAEPDLVGNQLNAEIQYQSVELPIGVRHYFYLTKNTQLFINAALVMDFSRNNFVIFTRADGSVTREIKNVEIPTNLFFGFGVKLFDRFTAETRVYTRRGILGNFVNYSNTSMVMGFRLF